MNMIEAARKQAAELVLDACVRCGLPAGDAKPGTVEIPKERERGDYSASFAMVNAKLFRTPPRAAAERIIAELRLNDTYFVSAEAAGPGFINFWLSEKWYREALLNVVNMGEHYGDADERTGERVMVEFVSANPTGPMTIGNARGGVLGDTLAAVLDKAGCDVSREFYVNDAGNQVDLFARSIEARYLQLIRGEDAVAFPEDGYHGDDIRELARLLLELDGEKYLEMPEDERRRAILEFALPHNISMMKKHLERYRIHFDEWFLESALHESGAVEETVSILTDGGHTYEKDGAVWLRNTDFGADKDEVLRRANGFYTYYAVDVAYHRNKFITRGFDRVIDVWGADHHGHAVRFKATMTAPSLGLEGKRLDFLIMQMVRLVRDGETVKVSKRTGKALTLNDLLDEISVDACRFFFNARPDAHLEFDLDLAVRQDSENPVYYVQYAHARICSLLKKAAEAGASPDAGGGFAAPDSEAERELIKTLALYPEEIRLAARDYDPSRINRYLIELAGSFHHFYNAVRIIGAEPPLMALRLTIADAVRATVKSGLELIGVSAPEKM